MAWTERVVPAFGIQVEAKNEKKDALEQIFTSLGREVLQAYQHLLGWIDNLVAEWFRESGHHNAPLDQTRNARTDFALENTNARELLQKKIKIFLLNDQ